MPWPPERRRSLFAAALLGIGLMAAVDEILFHQILAWHHFFDRATPTIGLLSDGLLHAAEVILTVTGFLMLMELRRIHALVTRAAWAGLLIGAGGFQLFDGTVNHKLLGLHQIRYVPEVWPYDLAWNGVALLLLTAGLVLARRRGGVAATGVRPTGR